MKYVRLVNIILIGLIALTLTACNKKPQGVNGSPYGDANTQTYGTGMDGGFQVGSDGRRINPLTAPANQAYYFEYDSNTVRAADEQAMRIQANYLASHPSAKIRLEGNTDNRGSREYNMGLGWRRDQAVAQYFKQLGVNPNQIEMISYGKERPVAQGDDEHSRSLNRRVDLVYKAQ